MSSCIQPTLFEKKPEIIERIFSRFKKIKPDELNKFDNLVSNCLDAHKFGNIHGYLMEPAVAYFISRVFGIPARAVGRVWYRNSRLHEDDIILANSEKDVEEYLYTRKPPKGAAGFSLKTYGIGHIQLSTDKESSMRLECEKYGEKTITDKVVINKILNSQPFNNFTKITTLNVIYDEKNKRYSFLTFNADKAFADVDNIKYTQAIKYATYDFCKGDKKIFFVRYGGMGSNALQRGPWSDTKKAEEYFDKITEGIKYTGSKRDIIPVLLELVRPLGIRTVFDGFSGTMRVSQAFKKSGYTVYSNDIAVWSKIFGECYLLNKKPASYYQPIIDHLNKIPGKYGWFSEHYGGEPNNGSSVQEDGKKRMWQLHNTIKLDAIRDEIDNITQDNIERSVLLTSLILAMDKVDSSLGHQVSYLRKWAPRAYNTMKMEVPKLILDDKEHKVYQKDIFDLLGDVESDLAYYDPPYGSCNELMPPSRVRYASYYHIWKTICLNDKPKVVGQANRREDVGDRLSASIFEEFQKDSGGQYIVIEAIEKLIKNTNAKYIVLSYNNKGRATFEAIIDVLSKLEMKSSVLEMDYKKNVMATMVWTKEWLNALNSTDTKNKEYLFLIQKTKKGEIIPEFKIGKKHVWSLANINQLELNF